MILRSASFLCVLWVKSRAHKKGKGKGKFTSSPAMKSQRGSRGVALLFFNLGRVHFKPDGTRWRTGGEVKGELANGVGSQYSSHYLGTWCIQHYYRWSAHLGCQQSTELTPPWFKWTRPFRRKKIWFLRVCHHISNAVYWMLVGGQRLAPTALPKGKTLGTHCIGGWVGPRTGLDGCGKSLRHRDSISRPSDR
jgi:hypothetical protein